MGSHDDKIAPSRWARRDSLLPVILEPDDEAESTTGSFTRDVLDAAGEIQVPTHPISSMQGAFAESMLEAAENLTPRPQPNIPDAVTRRRILLDQDITEETHATRWRQRPGQRYHELWKLMAQISFGIYLLLNGIAKDDEKVLTILQGHVDEVDQFLEMALEDFDLAIKDIDERLKFLRMPLENITIFDAMLEEQQFRRQIVTGNERIEHIITRTAAAMNDALRDVQHGLDATREFALYLAEEQEERPWQRDRSDMQKVYDAMKGNTEGWHMAYVLLQTRGSSLATALVQLGTIVAEMDRRAGEASRRTRSSVSPGTSPASPAKSSPPSSPDQTVSPPSSLSLAKDLPSDPAMITPAIRAALPAFQYVSEREKTPERQAENEKEVAPEDEQENAQPFTLEPRTYTPVPLSGQIQTPDIEEDSPEPPHKPTLRKTSASVSSSPISQREPSIPHRKDVDMSTHPVFRGSDSAYGSDTDKMPLHDINNSDKARPTNSPPPRNTHGRIYATSLRPDQRTSQPAKVKPHSPYQRPWTAGPSDQRSVSVANLSTKSQTIGTGNDKKLKKKRSAFGWLKKAFSLTEEEKAVFEARRRAPPPPINYGSERIFLDGRRIR